MVFQKKTGINTKYLTLPMKSSSSSSSPSPSLFNHGNSHTHLESLHSSSLPKTRKNRSLTRSRTIEEEDLNPSSHLGSITRTFSEKLPQRNKSIFNPAERSQWHTWQRRYFLSSNLY